MRNEWVPKYDEDGNVLNQLYDFDANGLYATVMQDENIRFPDLSSFEIIGDNMSLDEIKKRYKFYILEVDLFVPNSLQFIPISFKIPGQSGCFYMYGEHKNQHFCDVDLSEAMKVGIEIRKIHQGIGFLSDIPNFLSPYI